MDNFTLTANELEIMELLWSQGRPLSRTEIIDLTPERSWSAKSIHILLNKMLEKGAIEVSGFVRTNKNYGRTYAPSITKDEYLLSSLHQVVKEAGYTSKASATTSIFAALLQEKDINEEVISSLEQLLTERKKTLRNEH